MPCAVHYSTTTPTILEDYYNSVLNLVRAKNLRPHQSVLNAAHRVISRRSKYDHISDIIRARLH